MSRGRLRFPRDLSGTSGAVRAGLSRELSPGHSADPEPTAPRLCPSVSLSTLCTPGWTLLVLPADLTHLQGASPDLGSEGRGAMNPRLQPLFHYFIHYFIHPWAQDGAISSQPLWKHSEVSFVINVFTSAFHWGRLSFISCQLGFSPSFSCQLMSLFQHPPPVLCQ